MNPVKASALITVGFADDCVCLQKEPEEEKRKESKQQKDLKEREKQREYQQRRLMPLTFGFLACPVRGSVRSVAPK